MNLKGGFCLSTACFVWNIGMLSSFYVKKNNWSWYASRLNFVAPNCSPLKQHLELGHVKQIVTFLTSAKLVWCLKKVSLLS